METPEEINYRIFLVGFMGSGKSHWGKIWAAKFDLDFYDLDQIIEEKEGLSINRLFQEKGEAYFRNAETKALQYFSYQKNFILSCGGGTPCFNENMNWMNAHGLTVYLKPGTATIEKRLLAESVHRPLLKEIDESNLYEYIEHKIKEREHFYILSNLVLPEDNIHAGSLDPIFASQSN